MYIDRIDTTDMLFTVTIHEMFHQLGFTGVDYGHGSFSSKVDDDTYVYNGSEVVDRVLPLNATTDDNKYVKWVISLMAV